MATLTNASSHPIPLGELMLNPGEVLEGFDDAEAEQLKQCLFAKAEWLKIEPDAAP
ncbi:MAG: hypothetical protein ACTIOG_07510 [Pseudomonas helleri]|uniref:hypothetical protein n=1 Tax=Pseudomonas helleri TaxID=1608996 RepID=UPI003FCF75E3